MANSLTSDRLTAQHGDLAGAAGGLAQTELVLTLSCSERPGILSAVTGFLYEYGCNIIEQHHFDDRMGGSVFVRTAFSPGTSVDAESMDADFRRVANEFEMTYGFHGPGRPRLMVMVSKLGHCLNDLLFRWRGGSLGGDIVLVASNHEDLRPMAEAAGLPFFHIPVTPETKPDAERRIVQLVDEYDVDLVVLARYMQILSEDLCNALAGRAINIHHSFLPGFKGARPYHQAFERGVKLVGATAHYVTADLDEGPIIEQEVNRVDHSYTPTSLATVGQDAECLALARAVRWHCEHRVFLHANSTVVFR